MYIETLQLKNYGAFEDAIFDFNKGFTVLSGRTGQGKSHIIRAINYALLNKNFGTIDDDCNWNANNFSIHLILHHQGKKFDIKVLYDKKSGANKQLWVDEDYYSGNSDVTSKLSEYFDPSLTQAGIMSLQGKMDVVDATDSERRENLKKIYDLDFTKQVDSLKEEIADLEDKKQDLEKEIYNLQHKDYDYKEEKNLPFSKIDYDNKKKSLDTLRVKKVEQDKQIQEKEKIEKDIVYFTEQLESKNKKLTNLKNKIIEIRNSMDVLDSKKVEYRNTINSETSNLENEVNSITLKRVKSFDNSLIDAKENEKREVYSKLILLKKNLDLINQGKCPTCGHIFDNSEKYSVETNLKEIEEEYSKVNEELDALKKEKEVIDQEKESQIQLKNKKESLQNKLENKQEMLLQEEKNIEDKKEFYNNQKGDVEKDINEINNDIPDIEDKIEGLKKSLPTIDKTDYNSDIEFLSIEIKKYDDVVHENTIIRENNNALETQEKSDKLLLNKKKNEKDILNSKIQEYNMGVDILRKDFPNFVISTMVKDIEDGMNSLLDTAYNGRYHVTIKESKRGLQVNYGEYNKSIKLASGGEKNLFNIGFKNAFNEIAGLNILCLDESDNFMDDDIAKSCFSAIHDMILDNVLEQVIVITHKDIVKEIIETDFKGKIFNIEQGKIVGN